MPGGLGTSYRSLTGDVYKTTTTAATAAADSGKFNVLETMKKAFSFNSSSRGSDPLIPEREQPIVLPRKMPTSATAEETALLGKMPSDSMDDIELKNIQMHMPTSRSLSRDDPSIEEVKVDTDKGYLLVAIQGNRNKPAIVTYHDLGLNYVSNFQAFFNFSEMRALLENFCVYHVNAPGQEEGAAPLPDDYEYPTMDELGSQLNFVLGHFGLKSIIGIGVGAGGNILTRFALAHPDRVEALCLINVVSTQAGWIEWGYQKMNARYLKSRGMTQGVLDYLMWHHFGRGTEERNHDLVQVYKSYFERCIQPGNLAQFIDSYIRRTDLNMTRNLDPNKKENTTLTMPVMNITGALSPHVDDTVTLNARLDPTNSSWMKISDCGMVLEEQPNKISEALRLFLQGLGYAPTQLYISQEGFTATLIVNKDGVTITPVRVGRKRITTSTSVEGYANMLKVSSSIDSVRSAPGLTGNWRVNITENPLPDAVVC